jgi:hypothetical protein
MAIASPEHHLCSLPYAHVLTVTRHNESGPRRLQTRTDIVTFVNIGDMLAASEKPRMVDMMFLTALALEEKELTMSSESREALSGTKIYTIGNVGPGATAIQGENIHVMNALKALPEGDTLRQQFEALLKRIANAPDLDEDTRELATAKTQAVAQGLAEAHKEPSKLRLALRDAQLTLSNAAKWAWDGLVNVLKSEAAQKTIGTISEASVRGTMEAFIRGT